MGAAPVVREVPVRGAGPVRRLLPGAVAFGRRLLPGEPVWGIPWKLLRFRGVSTLGAAPVRRRSGLPSGLHGCSGFPRKPALLRKRPRRLWGASSEHFFSAPFSILSPIPLYPFRTGRALPRRPAACWGPSSSESGRSRSGRAGGTGRNRGGTGPEPGRNRA